jgi:voltage-gated potassium channel Kch
MHPDRLLWFDAITNFLVLFAVIVIEIWFLASMSRGKFDLTPYDCFSLAAKEAATRGEPVCPQDLVESKIALEIKSKSEALQETDTLQPDTSRPQDIARLSTFFQVDSTASASETRLRHRMTKLSWLCSGILCALIFFLWACLPNRLMKATLVPLTFHEVDIEQVLFKSHSYLYHYAVAMLLQFPILVLGGLAVTLVFLAAPIILTSADHIHLLQNLAQADEVILALGVFLAWFIPVSLAVVTPDETFGQYFNHRLADHIMRVQGHIVFIGYGELGKRVLNHEINQMRKLEQMRKLNLRERIKAWLLYLISSFIYAGLAILSRLIPIRSIKRAKASYVRKKKEKRKKMFFEVVTPDLRLEPFCSHAVVIEHNPKDVIYSGRNNLLGDYGVVSAHRHSHPTRDVSGNLMPPESRTLVPVVIGEAKEPFVVSRVNLERASLIISMVPDEESVQAVFERANTARVSSIICVTRSDQISYLTYRARHRPIVLVYPKLNQGIALGQRLWAAILKLRAVRNKPTTWWPNVLVIGNNKANHYMLENLWTHLPGDHKNRCKILEKKFAFVVTPLEEVQDFPKLQDKKTNKTYDQFWPATFVTGGRYPYPSDKVRPADAPHVPTRTVHAADLHALEACLEEHQPEILVINHNEVEKSLLILSRCMRALERLKTCKPSQFRLPFLLLAAARGDDWEQLSLGDASRYYDALCKLHNEELAGEPSYPEHAHYDHFQRKLIGESIIDALADVEEIITGARNTLLDPLKSQALESDNGSADRRKKANFIEVNGCLPNRPGALATYVARLAGINFQAKSKAEIDDLWRRANPFPQAQSALLPSFQYLRDITLDPERKAFALSGYATLAPFTEKSISEDPQKENTPLVARVFANDGRHHAEREKDPDAARFTIDKDLPERVLQKIKDPISPGVPQVIDRLTRHTHPGRHNLAGEFHQVMLDPGRNNHTGSYACPGMPICRIAAFQDYVVASNGLRLQRLAAEPNNAAYQNDKLLHARNYYCCTGTAHAAPDEIPHADSPYARIFCCCRAEDNPGLIAMVLNTLLFRSGFVRQAAENDSQNNWVINIEYFKDIACQNPHFALNRLFGVFQEKPKAAEPIETMPVRLLRILPIGSVDSARQWYYYGRALVHFLTDLDKQHKYIFYWLDEDRKPHDRLDDEPKFDKRRRSSFPVVLVIKCIENEKPPKADSNELCDLCGVQPKEYDCRKLRVWV